MGGLLLLFAQSAGMSLTRPEPTLTAHHSHWSCLRLLVCCLGVGGEHGGDGRCGLAVLDFSQNGVEVTIERTHGLISHDLAAIKGHGRYQFLRDMPPSPPPHPG